MLELIMKNKKNRMKTQQRKKSSGKKWRTDYFKLILKKMNAPKLGNKKENMKIQKNKIKIKKYSKKKKCRKILRSKFIHRSEREQWDNSSLKNKHLGLIGYIPFFISILSTINT